MNRLLSGIGVLAIGALLGALAYGAWSGDRWDRDVARWEHQRDAEVADSSARFLERLAALRARVLSADSAVEVLVLSGLSASKLSRKYADSVRVLRLLVGESTELSACQAGSERLAETCMNSLYHAETARELAEDRAAIQSLSLSTLAAQVATDSVTIVRLRSLLVAAPVGDKPSVNRLLGVLPAPTVSVGLGCAGGLAGQAACGLSLHVGIPIRF